MKKRLISLILVFVMLLTIAPTNLFSANAATSGVTGECAWSLNGTTLTISGNGYMGDYNYNTAYTKGPWGTSITKVIIKNGVANIGDHAFYNCSNLTDITISNSVTTIGDSAFKNCSNLVNINIPNSITNIGESAFYNCSNLINITIPDDVTSIGSSVFRDCSSLTNISIPNGVTDIGYYAFSGCESLISVNCPDSIISIKNNAFFNCKHLESITLSNNITQISHGVFSGCGNLALITIPNKVTSIGSFAFDRCSSLTSIDIPNSVTKVNDAAFQDCKRLTSIKLSNSITTIYQFTFNGCSSLTTINIPSSVRSINMKAFGACTSLSSIILPQSVTNISSYVFGGCTNLKEIWYTGTESQKKSIKFNSYNDPILSATWHYESCPVGAPHTYNNECDATCNNCDFLRVQPHKFENNCDTTCDCGYERTITHSYEIRFDDENHFEKCSVCDDIVNTTSHTFENECDTKCDCGFTRTVPHNHQPTFDDTNHFDKCTICDDKININKHSYDNECDAFCDCGYERSINYNDKFTTDDTITIQFSDSKEFELVVSDETIVKITELKTNKVQFGSYIEMSATAKLKPLKPGYVLVTAVDTTGKVLAKSILYIVEGEHQLVLSSVTKEATCTEAGEELYICKFCGYQEKKEVSILEHTYDNACDTTCVCGYEREITHNYQSKFDTENHFDKCTVCGDVINTKAHEFDNACDTDCACGYERTITHDYKDTYNAAGHFEECTVCGSIGDGAPHEFDNACDTDCDCGYTRITSHKYDNDFDAKCNICDAERTPPNTATRTFKDVASNAWYKQFVDYSVAYGIFSGTSASTFSPNNNITRAQFVQVLANLSGIDTSNSNINSGFKDVPKGQWYTAAVTWAAKNGIVNGVGNGKFDPNANVTREQMCVMLVNYAKFKGITLKPVEAKENFADNSKISSWAKNAVYICQQADIVNGKGAGKFDPSGTGTRAEACVIFTKFHKSYMK